MIRLYTAFINKVRRTKRFQPAFPLAASDHGKFICSYGAPGKRLLNNSDFGREPLEFTVNCNAYTHGRDTPCMHIPTPPIEAIAEDQPSHVPLWKLKGQISQPGELTCMLEKPVRDPKSNGRRHQFPME